ncbi:hypothetical protein F5887DRAFT_376424 [Amanita rubescens]|nr:hypothetical protein F5887DRAFT_376424 [Amanita rubescens]
MKDITENMLSMTQFMSLTIEARDQLRTIPAQTLAVLRQELGLLDDRDSSWMTPAERQRLIVASRRRRKSDSAGPAAALQPPNLVQLRGLPQQQPQQQRLKRSNATPEETRIDFSPPRKRHRPPPAQLPIQGISYSPQPQGPPSGPQPGQPGIPMTGQNPSMTMRAPPQMTGVPQGGQLRMGNPMNTGISQPPLGGPRLGVSLHQQGHANQPGRMNQQQQMYRMQNHRLKGPMPPQAMNPTTQGPPSSATPGSSDPTMHPGAPGGPQFNRLPPQNTLLGMIRPLSRAQNGANKDQGGSKGVKQEDPSRSAGRAPNASGAAPATPAPGAPANQGPTPATNGAPNSNIAQSPSSGTPLNPGPIVNQGLALADPLFPPDFIQHISNSLHDFNTRMFPAETDINSERDFGHWFNSDDLDSTERAWLAYLPV